MGRLFESPWAITIIIIVVVLLFAAPKLPGMARSLGQSMRIIKSEVKEMKNDGKDAPASAAPAASAPPAPAAPMPPAPAAPMPPVYEAPVEGRIVNDPNRPGTPNGTGV